MQYEEFVLRQLKRNEKIYSVCMKVFLVFMIVFVLALIGILIGGLGIEMTIFDVILMLIIAVEYPTFKKLKDQANFEMCIRDSCYAGNENSHGHKFHQK